MTGLRDRLRSGYEQSSLAGMNRWLSADTEDEQTRSSSTPTRTAVRNARVSRLFTGVNRLADQVRNGASVSRTAETTTRLVGWLRGATVYRLLVTDPGTDSTVDLRQTMLAPLVAVVARLLPLWKQSLTTSNVGAVAHFLHARPLAIGAASVALSSAGALLAFSLFDSLSRPLYAVLGLVSLVALGALLKRR